MTIYLRRKYQAPDEDSKLDDSPGWSNSDTNLPVGMNLCGGVTSASLGVLANPQSPGQ